MYPRDAKAAGASLNFSPSQAEYLIDSTFDVSVLVNTGEQAVNTVEANITFPPDKLQVVSPSVGKSFIQVWVAGPSYSNTAGTISFSGGLPHPGVVTSSGVISTISFRAKAAGRADLKFLDTSKVLADDGQGTSILTSKSSASLNIKLTPPTGPVVSSPTHEDQNKWYTNRSINFLWERQEATSAFSYVFDDNPGTIPDEQSETEDTHVTLQAKADGIWFFHIRGKNQSWGGTTHYLVHIDSTPPAAFSPIIEHSVFLLNTGEIVAFHTTDGASGIDHYEVRIIADNNEQDITTLFTEQKSPYEVPQLTAGKYKLVVRAFDKAGNTIDGTTSFRVVSSVIEISARTKWLTAAEILIVLLLLLVLYLWLHARKKHLAAKRLSADLDEVKANIQEKERELNALKSAERITENIKPDDTPLDETTHRPFDNY